MPTTQRGRLPTSTPNCVRVTRRLSAMAPRSLSPTKHVLPQVNAERLNVHDVLPLGEQFELFYPRRGRTIPLAKEMTGVSR